MPKCENFRPLMRFEGRQNRLNILHGGTLACMTDLGGSLAVASRGLFATGVSTDLSGMGRLSLSLLFSSGLEASLFPTSSCHGRSFAVLLSILADRIVFICPIVTYLASGGQVGDLLRAEVTCDKCEWPLRCFNQTKAQPQLTKSVNCIVGKSLAYTSIKFTNLKEELVARGSHTK